MAALTGILGGIGAAASAAGAVGSALGGGKSPGSGSIDIDSAEIVGSREKLGATDEAFRKALASTYSSSANPFLQQQQDFRSRQVSLADILAQRAAGQGQSLVDPMVAEARENALAQQLALQGSGRGNVGLLQRQSAQNVANISQAIEREAMQRRLQEIFQARQELSGLLGQGRGADIQAGQVASQEAIGQGGLRQALLGQALQREKDKAALLVGNVAAGNQASQYQGQQVGNLISGAGGVLGKLPGIFGGGQQTQPSPVSGAAAGIFAGQQ